MNKNTKDQYQVVLVNSSGLVFDSARINGLQSALAWAKGRGYTYTVMLTLTFAEGIPPRYYSSQPSGKLKRNYEN